MNSKQKLVKKWVLKVLLLLEVFMVFSMNFFFAFRTNTCIGVSPSVIPGNNWMSEIPGDISLCDINIPGTNDSGTTFTTGVVTGLVASCQDDTIPEQLEKGIRYLDIRCDSDLNINHGGVACYSSFLTIGKYKLTFPKLLDDIEKFLEENPSETVLLQLKKEGGGKGDFVKNINDSLKLSKRVFRSKDSCISNISLDDVRGKIVILSKVKGIDVPYHFEGWKNDCTYCSSKLAGAVCVVQDNYKAKTHKEKMRVIENFYERVWNESLKNKFVINFTSCVGPYCPEFIAKKINPKFESYVKQNKGKKFGIILMDVPKESLISAIYSSNFSDAKSSAVPQV